jgi:hypothetical protein
MPSLAHEIAVTRLVRDPSLLYALAEKILGKRPPARPSPVDSTVRFVDPAEVRPDLILARGRRGPWDAIEVQRRIDWSKAWRWLLLVALLHAQRGRMGDLWVITASKRVAEWARTVCDATGRKGTWSRMQPIVLLLGREEVAELLDKGRPSLAFFAAWAMQGRHGPDAQQVVEQALEITDLLPDTALRREQGRDIMGVLDRRMMAKLRETIMDERRRVESRWVKELRDELFGAAAAEAVAKDRPKFVAEGKREALLAVLKGRGLSISREQRAAILACDDLAKLGRWVAASVKAASVGELLGEAPKKNGARNGTAKQRAVRAG